MKLIISSKQRSKIQHILKYSDNLEKFYNDETLWTWFVVKILENPKYNNSVVDYFFNKSIRDISKFKIGFEVQPISPRSGKGGNTEGNTHLDLAIGNIEKRKGTESGIKYDSTEPNTVCFVEAKLFSDLSTGISHDKFRNQMIRVIENLLCFQDDSGNNPDDICFTLLTPRQFKLKPKSRLYGYKFLEYSQDIANGGSLIEYDINQLKMDKRFTTSWKYPIIAERLKKLTLNWATYEDIFESVINQTIDLFDKDSLESIINYLEKENIITT